MKEEYLIRRKIAEEISEKICDLTIGVLIVSSVAYNPAAVRRESDLDMVVVLDFSSVDFKELYQRIARTYEPVIAKYASEKRFNTFSIVWETAPFEIGLHLWDKTAFENVIRLQGYNAIFRRANWPWAKKFKSTASSEIFKNLTGEEKEVFKESKEVEGGTILRFHPYFQDATGFYTGIQIHNLLLDPVILYETDHLITNGIIKFKENLRRKLVNDYGAGKSINLFNALPSKLQQAIPDNLK